MRETNEINGIVYNNDNEERRGRVSHYHGTARLGFNDHSKGAKNTDIAQLKTIDVQNFKIDGFGDYQSKFTIGMEVEKTRFYRGAVKQYPLFAGFETDSSCGYEAVTHILPLLPAGQWRNKVYSMMHDAKRIIDDGYSPSSTRCGGHITLAVDGMTGEEIANAIRKNVGIVYALFRKRLGNHYCNSNPLIAVGDGAPTGRYQSVLVKGDVIEFRVVSRFQSVKQMMRRYELFYELLNFSINNPNGNHNTFLKRITPIIKSMYAGDMDKVNFVLELSKYFRKYLTTGKVNRGVVDILDPTRSQMIDSYDRDLLTNGYR
tara:strand:+ start:4942 stop:5892 length:951 start_codon:yes stop_codon:yes gene_type:complete